ncbi:MAG: hypothetical protein MJ105_01195 [Lachnospiraceae bacterium]|nr:hypothetical protein [Lachnospiraceae bacterium]
METKRGIDEKILRRTGMIILILAALGLLFVVIRRAILWPILWDEGVTYCAYVHPMFGEYDLISGLKNYWWHMTSPLGCTMCLGNNHILNSVGIGIVNALTGICYDETLIRIPIMICFVIYLAASIIMYKKRYISFSTVIFFWSSTLVIEYFSMARGYGMAAAFVILALLFLEASKKKETNKGKNVNIILCIFALTIAEVANTVSFLSVFVIYVYIFICILREKRLGEFLKKTWIPLIPLVAMNLVMVLYHFKTVKYDNLETAEGFSFFSIIRRFVSDFCIRSDISIMILVILGLLIAVAVTRVVMKKDKIDHYKYVLMFLAYVLIIHFLRKVGQPVAREHIPAYPLFVMAIGELVRGLTKTVQGAIKKDCTIPRIIINIGLMVFCIWSLLPNFKNLNMDTSSGYLACRDKAYALYEAGEQVDYSYFYDQKNIQGIWFYRNKILHDYGYEILTDTTGIWPAE